MVNSHADMLVPGWNESIFAIARSNVSCTKSSARSTLPHNEIANARRLGTAASIASRTDGRIVMSEIPCCQRPWPRTDDRARGCDFLRLARAQPPGQGPYPGAVGVGAEAQ